MKKNILLLILVFAGVLTGWSQEGELTVYDCEVGRYTYLKPENKSNLTWRNEKGYTYNTEESLVYNEVNSNKDKELLSVQTLNEVHDDHQFKSLSRFPTITWIDSETFRYQHDHKVIFYHIKNQEITYTLEIPVRAEFPDISPDNKKITYTLNNDLFLNDKNKGEVTVAASNHSDIEFGKSVHRNEFGISKGTYWSPNSNYLAFYKNDQSEVSNYPMVTITERPAALKSIKYPMAGMKSEHVSIGVYHLETGKTVYLKTGVPKDKYLTNLQWSPDEKFIYVAVLNRDQNHMEMHRYEVHSGELNAVLFEERHNKYTEPQNPIEFLKGNHKRFIWQSRRDGYNHFYLYNTEGELVKQLTSGEWEVLEYLGQDEQGKNILFTANKTSPLDENIYSVDISTNSIIRLCKTNGVHQAVLNSNASYIIDSYSNTNTPRNINIINNKGALVKTILQADNPLKDYTLGNTTVSTMKAADNQTDLYYRLVLPVDFDSTCSYPVILYVYNGPHVQLIKNSWIGRTELWQQYMAQKGYISFTLDGRGSANRGLEFENVTFRQLGIIEMEDQLTGLNFLKSLSYVDPERIGIYGWSYGGFMTTSLMVNYPDIFKVGIAGGPVMDWKYYEVMYTERYMDTPQKNPAGYEKTSVLDKAENLNGKLLIIHGAQDPVVVWQHSQLFLRKCIENRKQINYFVYPTHEHNVQGIDRVHLTEQVSQYFIEHL